MSLLAYTALRVVCVWMSLLAYTVANHPMYSVQCTTTVTVSSMHATNDVMKISHDILYKYNFMIQLKFSAARAIHV